ncbi:hypothetical protein P8822_00220 [Bacillus sonorensis]|uniref:hypothetical protein n=1 Tax=Bacillus subtilis group TaxID=653685 RepID=UPI001FD70108|nr:MULTISPECIES: hypothetical protein [Bacillus subtilis group]MCJ8223696.1 hypothetical protein [Bacillus paralicheniformis]MEC0526239.1 hypothetical protein [Bacillus sonorensis]
MIIEILAVLLLISILLNLVLWYKQSHFTEKYTRKYFVNENEVTDTFLIKKKGSTIHLKATRNKFITIELLFRKERKWIDWIKKRGDK